MARQHVMGRKVSVGLALAALFTLALGERNAAAQSAPRCDALPNVEVPKPDGSWKGGHIGEAQCDALGIPGLPAAVRSGTAALGGELKFTDSATQFQCEIWVNGSTQGGRWKKRTICGAGYQYIDEDGGGHYRCQEKVPVTFNPRKDCLAGMQLAVSDVKWENGTRSSEVHKSLTAALPYRILVFGTDVASATAISATASNGVNVVATRVSGPSRYPQAPCVGFNCLMIDLVLLPSTADGPMTITLTPPQPARGTSFTVNVKPPAMRSAASDSRIVVGAATPATPAKKQQRTATATVGCAKIVKEPFPRTIPMVAYPSEVFEISAAKFPNGAPVHAVTSLNNSRKDSAGLFMLCGGEEPMLGEFGFVISNVSGGSDVSVRWRPDPRNNPGTDQLITLPPGKWQIRPETNANDDTFPPDFVYQVLWTE